MNLPMNTKKLNNKKIPSYKQNLTISIKTDQITLQKPDKNTSRLSLK